MHMPGGHMPVTGSTVTALYTLQIMTNIFEILENNS